MPIRFSAALLTSFVATSFAPILLLAQNFSDVRSETSYSSAIESLRSQGVIEGYGDGSFRPQATINRAEFLKIVLESRDDATFDGSGCFPDVNNEWFAKYVCTAKQEGIIAGYPDGTFKPEQTINFVEASKILSLAFKQSVEQYSPDWYEPYARALEGAKAIPLSIAKLGSMVTRGEMAEMLWRLTEGMTDEATKGYLNVKYPELSINLASDKPQQAGTCADLRVFTEEAQRGGYAVNMMKGTVVPTMAPERAASESDGGAQGDYSQTNVQVAGVDEADIVKTDGTYLYAITEGRVRIVRALPAVGMKQESIISFEDGVFSPRDLYIDGSTLVVLGEAGGGPVHILEERMMIWPGPQITQRAEARIYDVSDHASPTLKRKVSFDGWMLTTRKIDDMLYLVVNNPVQYWGQPVPLGSVLEKDLLPRMEDSAEGEEKPVTRCGDVTILPHVPSPQYLTVAAIPLSASNDSVKTKVVLGSAENVYASLNNLYVTTTENRFTWNTMQDLGASNQTTHVYRFAFTDDGIAHQSQGKVPGRVLNQFSMDEHGSAFRIATTQDGQWSPAGESPSSNNLFVLNLALEQVGAIEDIAPGEQIYSVRFLGDRAYMVTFRRIDPFFVIDLSDDRSPKILGQLKIPGYSDYLHPYDENHIIGFGKEAEASKDGDFAWYQGMKVAIFDVTDVKNPKERHRMTIGDRGTESPLLHDHKALLFDRERNLLAFPVRVHKIPDAQKQQADPGSAWGDPIFQGAHVYDISLSGGFKLRGTITHYTDEDLQKAGAYFYGKDIDRIVRIGENLFTLSPFGVKASNEKSVETVGTLPYPKPVSTLTCPESGREDVKYVTENPDECALVKFMCEDGMEPFFGQCGCGCMSSN